MRTWLRISLLAVLLMVFVFIELFAYIWAIGHGRAIFIGTVVFWGTVLIVNVIISYSFLRLAKDLENNRLIAMFFTTIGLALLTIMLLVVFMQLWWVYYTIPGPVS